MGRRPMPLMTLDQLPLGQSAKVTKLTGAPAVRRRLMEMGITTAATVQAIRLYKEARSGLGDSIGVAELATMVYTKAFPQRVTETLNVGNYARIAPWT